MSCPCGRCEFPQRKDKFVTVGAVSVAWRHDVAQVSVCGRWAFATVLVRPVIEGVAVVWFDEEARGKLDRAAVAALEMDMQRIEEMEDAAYANAIGR